MALNSRVISGGAVWGEDFVLSDVNLIHPVRGFALTYLEVLCLTRANFMKVGLRTAPTGDFSWGHFPLNCDMWLKNPPYPPSMEDFPTKTSILIVDFHLSRLIYRRVAAKTYDLPKWDGHFSLYRGFQWNNGGHRKNFRGEHKMIVTGQLVTGDRSSREGGSVVPSWGRLCGSSRFAWPRVEEFSSTHSMRRSDLVALTHRGTR